MKAVRRSVVIVVVSGIIMATATAATVIYNHSERYVQAQVIVGVGVAALFFFFHSAGRIMRAIKDA